MSLLRQRVCWMRWKPSLCECVKIEPRCDEENPINQKARAILC